MSMRKIYYAFATLFMMMCVHVHKAQVSPLPAVYGKADSLALNDTAYRAHYITFYVYDIHSSSGYRDISTNRNMGTTSSRSLRFYLKVGEEGMITHLKRKGVNLRDAIADDPEAMKLFNQAYKKHLRKKRLANVLEYFSYAVAFSAVVPLVIGIDDENSALIAPAAVGVAGGLTGIYAFHHITEKQMDKFRDCLVACVQTYNDNLRKKIKK